MEKLAVSFLGICLAFMQLGFAGDAFSHKCMELAASNQKIELMVQKPQNQTFQVILFLHGANDLGLNSITPAHLNHWLEKGYAVAAISMPGFGRSTGEKDFCGPVTLDALNQAINEVKNELGVSRFAIVAFGQGGQAATLLAAQRSDIIGIVCANGGYDLFRHKKESDPLFSALVNKGYKLDLSSDEALTIRSPIYHLSKISSPLFLLHRNGNPVVQETEVIDFYHAMLAAGKECCLVLRDKMLEDDAQKLSYQEILSETESWLDALMKKE